MRREKRKLWQTNSTFDFIMMIMTNSALYIMMLMMMINSTLKHYGYDYIAATKLPISTPILAMLPIIMLHQLVGGA